MRNFCIAAAFAAAAMPAPAFAQDENAYTEELRAEIAASQSKLPITTGDAIWESAEMHGTNAIYELRFTRDYTTDMFENFGRAMYGSACNSERKRDAMADGLTITFKLRDSEGEETRFTFESCG